MNTIKEDHKRVLDINIELENSAFGETKTEEFFEIARILEETALKFRLGVLPSVIRDINGNRTGSIEIKAAEL